MAAPVKAARYPEVQEERPHAKAVLPFRLQECVSYGVPSVLVHWEAEVQLPLLGEVRIMPFSEDANVCNWGKAVVRLMKMYWQLEAKVDGLLKDRDEAVAAKVMMEGELKREQARTAELERRIKRKEG